MVMRGDLVLLSGASSAEEMKLGKELSEKVVQLWDGWELRVMVCLSLVLQIILIMLGSRRRYTARRWITFIVWSSFLVADTVATTTLGILACQGKSGNDKHYSIRAFWAPFLLLHLGGPDTIIAYSIQDRELWLRHLLGLVIQVAIVFYVFLMAWIATTTTLTFLTIPMLVYGIMKYGEKTLSLSLPPNYPFSSTGERYWFQIVFGPIDDSVKNPIHQAYNLFWHSMFTLHHIFYRHAKGELKMHDAFYKYISGKSAEYVFELVEMELGLFYDVFYTKARTMYSILGIPFRLVSLVCCITTLVSFFTLVDKKPYSRPDVGITYLLLWGAIVLEVYAFTCLVFSDWIMLRYFTDESHEGPTNSVYALHKNFTKGRRWCRSIAQLSFIRHYTHKISPKFLEKMMKSMYTADREVVEPELKKMIFDQLLQNGEKLHAAPPEVFFELRDKLTAQRGDGVLERMKDHPVYVDPVYVECKRVVDSEFSQSLFTWHIVTDLCYYDHRDVENLSLECQVSKWLSDYMMYLMVMRPSMLPKGIHYYKETNFIICCQRMRRFTGKMESISVNEMNVWVEHQTWVVGPTDSEALDPLVDGCKLAKKLQELETKRKWEMISKIWIEMLGYAAIRCEWREHLEGLGRGGELLTHVCVLMTHLGLSLPSEMGRVPV